jgi:hypothetical protein
MLINLHYIRWVATWDTSDHDFPALVREMVDNVPRRGDQRGKGHRMMARVAVVLDATSFQQRRASAGAKISGLPGIAGDVCHDLFGHEGIECSRGAVHSIVPQHHMRMPIVLSALSTHERHGDACQRGARSPASLGRLPRLF